MERLYIKPARKGLVVRDPETMRPLAEGGEHKPRNSHWIRRLNDGDVVNATPKKGGTSGSTKSNSEG